MVRQDDKSAGGERDLTKADSIELIVKALVAGIPYVGGALSVAIFETMERKRQRRVEAFMGKWTETLKDYAEKIDRAYFETDEFEGVFRRTMHKVQAEPDEAKQFLAHNLLARNTIEGDPEAYDFDSYVLELIGSLTPLHFECLFALAKQRVRSNATRMGHYAEAGFHTWEQISTAIRRAIDELDPVMMHLASLGLCLGTEGAVMIGGVQSPASLAFALSDAGRKILLRVQAVTGRTVKLQGKK